MTRQEKKRKKEIESKIKANENLTLAEYIEFKNLIDIAQKHREKVNKRVEIAMCITIVILLAVYWIVKLF